VDFEPFPSNKISSKIVLVWRISELFTLLIVSCITLALLWVFAGTEWIYRIVQLLGSGLIAIVIVSFCLQGMQQRAWRYEVWNSFIEISKGILFKQRLVIPLGAVQFVDTKQGPVEQLFGLMSVVISTAAGSHRLPGLEPKVAVALREEIVNTARLNDEK
jgi:hypothetical protein